MRIAIFGAGGVGGYFGGCLARAGLDVHFIARGAHLRALRTDGVRVSSIDGDFELGPVVATDSPTTVGPVDTVLVAVKAWQVQEAAAAIGPMVGPETCVVPLLNGVEAPEQLASVLGERHVLSGLCGIFAWVEAPGHIRHAGVKPYIKLGERDNRRSERALAIASVLDGARGIDAEVPDDIHVAVWRKFQFVAPMSGVGGVTRAPIGVLRSTPQTRELLAATVTEVHDVARARGVQMPDDSVAQVMRAVDALPPEVTASMQRDVMTGRPSELEAQTGAIVRLGAAAGVPTPANAFLYASLAPQERRARGEVEFD